MYRVNFAVAWPPGAVIAVELMLVLARQAE